MDKNNKNKIAKIVLENQEELIANNYILATGGKSYPASGSSGDAYEWLKNIGHNIIKTRPGLTAIILKEKFIKELEGLSLNNINLSLIKDGQKINSYSGDIIFTANGISGPASLNLSRHINTSLNNLKITLDFFPDINSSELNKKLQILFNNNGQKTFKNTLSNLLAPKLIPVILKLSNINDDKQTGLIKKIEREAIVDILKNLELNILTINGFDKAMITVGGLDVKEIDPKTMCSKIISNLFIAGELLDLDGPTGGYNLQICWSTGYVAGENAVK